MKKFIALFDIHFGWEKIYDVNTSRFKERPTHDPKFLRKVLDFTSDFRPDVFILGGDQFNFDALRNNRRGRAEVLTQSEGDIRKTYDVAKSLLFEPLSRYPWMKKVVIRGNHDLRLEKFIRNNPEWGGLIEPQDYCQLTTPDWQFLNHGEHFKLGKLYFLHGDALKCKASDSAKRAAQVYGKNVRIGHFHTYASATLYSAIDEEVKTAISCPCACTRDMEWMGRAPNTWIQGLLYGYVNANGSFQDYVVIRGAEKLIIEGKEY